MKKNFLRTLVVGSLVSIGMTGTSLAQSKRNVSDPEAYAIYSLLIASERRVSEGRLKKIVIPDETQGHPEVSECFERSQDHDRTIGLLVLAYREVNKSPWRFQRKFDLPIPYELVPEKSFASFFKDPKAGGWDEFYKKYPDSDGTAFAMSAVGFNPEKTRALVYIGYGCGYVCGSGRYHMLEKAKGKWNEISFMPESFGCGVVS